MILAILLAAASASATSPPSGIDIAKLSNVAWTDAKWTNDGSGAMPIGNGDAVASVWVDDTNGDLRVLLAKSDVFDETGQPVKTGAVRFSFDPPLWTQKNVSTSKVAQSSCPSGVAFCQMLDISTSTVTIITESLVVSLAFDLNTPLRDGVPHQDAAILNIDANSVPGAGEFGLRVTLEPYRVEGATSQLGAGLCQPGIEHADVIVPVSDTITWYHWNHLNTTFFNDTIANQGVDPEKHPELADPFTHRAYGASISAGGLSSGSGSQGLTITSKGRSLTDVAVVVKMLTLEPYEAPTEATWPQEIGKVTPGPNPAKPSPPEACNNTENCPTTWEEIMSRSYIHITSNDDTSSAAKQLTDHVNWDRYLNLIQGRVAYAAIKFNGQAFTANTSGKGWDYRQWGAGYWWQNTRQPYYNVLAQGDVDMMRAFLDFYYRMLPYVQARTKAQFTACGSDCPPITGGLAALYEETCTQFGFYNPNGGLGWGCNSSVPRPQGASQNTYIRFHFTGSLELSLMVLDHWDAYGDVADLKKYLAIPMAVVEGYRQRFPNRNVTTGKIDMWPAQALETYQCPDPTSRTACPTNPTTDIAGLMAVLSRLIALPSNVGLDITASQRQLWKDHLAALPPLPTSTAEVAKGTYNTHKVTPVAAGGPKRHNSENAAMYSTHPFRIFGTGKPELTLAQQTYAERPSPCNKGWCQDVIQAAMLNLTDEAASQLADRAAAAPATGFRFPGFAQHYQDFEPSLDHFAFMRTALNYMLMSPVDDAKRSMLLFPTFPVKRWNVRFKLHAPRNTTIEASCQGGKLDYLFVTPPERRADITILNCIEADDQMAVSFV